MEEGLHIYCCFKEIIDEIGAEKVWDYSCASIFFVFVMLGQFFSKNLRRKSMDAMRSKVTRLHWLVLERVSRPPIFYNNS